MREAEATGDRDLIRGALRRRTAAKMVGASEKALDLTLDHVKNRAQFGRPIGNFHYSKQLAKGEVLCEVRVFLFRVEEQLDEWPEKGQRETKWFDANAAADIVEEGGLAEIICRFAGSYVRFVAFQKS